MPVEVACQRTWVDKSVAVDINIGIGERFDQHLRKGAVLPPFGVLAERLLSAGGRDYIYVIHDKLSS
jgi:hypothetical protein